MSRAVDRRKADQGKVTKTKTAIEHWQELELYSLLIEMRFIKFRFIFTKRLPI
jgi:hypothetical protein